MPPSYETLPGNRVFHILIAKVYRGLGIMYKEKYFNNKHIHYCNHNNLKRNEFNLSVLTWNIYLGADLTPLAGGITPTAVTQVFRQFLATNFPVRTKAIARKIALKKPELIGLQEAVRWRIEIPYFKILVYDFVEILLAELKEKGLIYEIDPPAMLSSVIPKSTGGFQLQTLTKRAPLAISANGTQFLGPNDQRTNQFTKLLPFEHLSYFKLTD
jgi:hypothetical protein